MRSSSFFPLEVVLTPRGNQVSTTHASRSMEVRPPRPPSFVSWPLNWELTPTTSYCRAVQSSQP